MTEMTFIEVPSITNMRISFRHFLIVLLLLTGLRPAQGNEPVGPPPELLLAEVYAGELDPSPYWVSEKLDGVRAAWDGKALRFRSGSIVHAPEWFVAGFPPEPLDGELWIARGRFEQLSGIVRRLQPQDAEWQQVRYMVFELPGAPGSFTERISLMQEIMARANVPWLHAVAQFRVGDRATLMQRMDAVVQAGGEGLMLHLADASYLTGRSDVLLKLKPWQDAEATVTGYTPGTGKYTGMTGALRVQMPEGKRFLIGSGLSNEIRRHPPPIGTLITYRYQALTKDGVPRFAHYLRVRENF